MIDPMPEPLPPPPSKRGRPSLARVNAIDRIIIETARAQFLSDGFDAVAMEQIATQAGVSKGTLYSRHTSKEALFTAVIEETVANWSDEASSEDFLLTEDIEQRLRHHANIIARWLRRPDTAALNRVVQAVQDRFPVVARAMHDRGFLFIVDVIATDVKVAAARDGIPVREPHDVGRLLVSSISGFVVQESMGQNVSKDELYRFSTKVVDFLMAARAQW